MAAPSGARLGSRADTGSKIRGGLRRKAAFSASLRGVDIAGKHKSAFAHRPVQRQQQPGGAPGEAEGPRLRRSGSPACRRQKNMLCCRSRVEITASRFAMVLPSASSTPAARARRRKFLSTSTSMAGTPRRNSAPAVRAAASKASGQTFPGRRRRVRSGAWHAASGPEMRPRGRAGASGSQPPPAGAGRGERNSSLSRVQRLAIRFGQPGRADATRCPALSRSSGGISGTLSRNGEAKKPGRNSRVCSRPPASRCALDHHRASGRRAPAARRRRGRSRPRR